MIPNPKDLSQQIEELAKYVQGLTRVPIVLLVDDSESDMIFMERALKESGVSIETESTHFGCVALSRLAEIKFDLIFLDLRMQGLNGIDVIEQMPDENKDTPVVILSHLDNGPLVDRAISLGAWLHLRKPIQPELLKKMLTRVKL